MTIKELSLSSLVAALVLSSACVVDDDPGQDTDTETNATTMTATSPTSDTMTDPTMGTTTNSTDPDTTATDTDPTTDTDTDSDTDTDTDTGDPDNYMFREDDPSAYTQVDRMGFPAVNTALIAAENKDTYNQSAPTDDTAGTFAGDIIDSIDFLHLGNGDGDGLDDELLIAAPSLPSTPDLCTPPALPADNCVQQGGPFVFPDVIHIDTAAPAAFPNGRDLETPVVDVILAVLLLDVLNNQGEFNASINAFADMDPMTDGNQGLSQSANDVAFPGAFPYLAPAHE